MISKPVTTIVQCSSVSLANSANTSCRDWGREGLDRSPIAALTSLWWRTAPREMNFPVLLRRDVQMPVAAGQTHMGSHIIQIASMRSWPLDSLNLSDTATRHTMLKYCCQGKQCQGKTCRLQRWHAYVPGYVLTRRESSCISMRWGFIFLPQMEQRNH